MNIEFIKDGVIKKTHKKFADELIAVGWSIVKKEKPVKKTGKKKDK